MFFCPSWPVIATAQQFSDSYIFLKAVRDQDNTKVTKFLNEPGQTIVNTKNKGESAIHIVIKRRDMTYLQDGTDNSPLMLAVEAMFPRALRC